MGPTTKSGFRAPPVRHEIEHVVFNLGEIATQQISGYGPVDVAELNPLTLSWNQVHFLVRENLLAIDELRDIHDKIYEEIHECFGLERCRKQENFIDGPPPRNSYMNIYFTNSGGKKLKNL